MVNVKVYVNKKTDRQMGKKNFWRKVHKIGKKTMGKKEKLLDMRNFSFSHSVFKRLVLQTRKIKGLFGKGFNLKASVDNSYNGTQVQQFQDQNHCVKRRKCWLPEFLPFPTLNDSLRKWNLKIFWKKEEISCHIFCLYTLSN